MIARTWHGTTKKEDVEAYSNFLKQTAIPDYKNTPGFIKLIFLRHIENEIAHFTLLTFWENLQVVESFSGNDISIPKYYEEDKLFLLEFEQKVIHQEVFAE